MVREIKIPSEKPSVREALAYAFGRGKGKKSSVDNDDDDDSKEEDGSSDPDLRLRLEADFDEPAEAWPLEIDGSSWRKLQILGPGNREATLRDLSITCDVTEGHEVLIRGVTIRGRVALNGLGCRLQDCEVMHGIEVSGEGGGLIKSCDIRGRGIGISIRGPLALHDSKVTGCNIGIAIYGVVPVQLQRSSLEACRAAGIVQHCQMQANAGDWVELALELDDSNSIEVLEGPSTDIRVEVGTYPPLNLTDEWPLTPGSHLLEKPRGGKIRIDIDDDALTLSVTEIEAPPEKTSGRKKKWERPQRASGGDREVKAVGPAWAHRELGLTEGHLFSAQDVRAAYRRRAREVHPDKQQRISSVAPAVVDQFHNLTEAYETLLQILDPDAACASISS
eukprot:CAMPEP_0206489366 /NCGR_PEP_ID=MMETSP0324_2-20121206/43182_1 /ASSEMBLY_ACC=CAM_ASM_000836 /TAXON_ID=2866 /ORGANISM="Crypthecodinium cohnii, Strain Seligo" /LENGTH=391 /DNA_ID=CAMNT_0053969001 /DNA_START=34 /DNA_END=1206 /DNA_ORIENTATION=-